MEKVLISNEEVLKTETSPEFRKLRDHLNVTSYHKYGPIATNYGKGLGDAIQSAKNCIADYEETGSLEKLADACNYLEFAFKYPKHPKAHRKHQDDGSGSFVGMCINEIKKVKEDSRYD